jgi:hypothetical protein
MPIRVADQDKTLLIIEIHGGGLQIVFFGIVPERPVADV